MAIQVSLDPTANPAVTVQPPIHSVNNGNETIKWEPAANQDFTFDSLSFKDNPSCFGSPSIAAGEITVMDNNQNTGPEIGYPYTIVVKAPNGQTYSSHKTKNPTGDDSSPAIRNK